MAYSFIQSNFANSNSFPATLPVTLTSNVTAGDLLVVCVVAGPGTLSVTDNNSNTYTALTANLGGAGNIGCVFYSQGSAGGSTTITAASGNALYGLYACEYSGILTSGSLIAANGNTITAPGAGTDTVVGSNTISVSSGTPALLFSFAVDNSIMNNATSTGAAPTAGTILTYNTHATGLVSPQGAGSLVGCTVSDTRLVTPPGNITPTFGCISANASDTFTIFFGAFTELPPPAPATIAWIK